MAEQLAINLKRVGVKRGQRWILRDVNWAVPAGACCAILGPNGSGKSTLARVLAAHLWPTTGECEVLGGRFGEVSLPELRQSIRLVQAAGPYDVEPELTAREVVETGFFGTLGLYAETDDAMERDADALLAQVGLSHVSAQPYATLSSGERVRSLIARALAARPKLLLLDEPTSGLDLLAREQVLATVQSLFDRKDRTPPTVVFITHHVEELPPATSQVLLLDNGVAAAAGAPADVLRSEVMSGVYRCPLDVRYLDGRWSIHVHPAAWDGLLERRDS
ncbi:MAG: iron complex transport system ATP-binding protein [Humisphaera sp.]|nr:iron complex transport system ATP-binding protein [Humisphaera sp.]